jgi:hypothetical protein
MSFKGQVSVEYLIIIGLSFAVLIPTGYFFYAYSQTSNDEAIRLQINQLGNELLKNAESIYGLAEGSLISVDIRYPKNIRDMYVLNQNELVIRFELTSGYNDAVFFSKIPLSGYYDLSRLNCSVPCVNSTFTVRVPEQGRHTLKFESKTNYVLVTSS